ncbi:MAG: glycoside hydrolase family 3 C-terminal domain-containing protein, partial [Lachnospiraceae bacterium]|nr:glycoside hydrolase family 3 C-terminal domain-containing protein [Lachnospiraceae bacterium]
MGRYALDMEKYADLARTASAEGCVLLKNDNSTLPLKKGDKVAVFGRMAFHYYKSGLGSGGLVNTRYVVGILDALRACKDIALDEELIGIYEKWIKDHPYDEGEGWGLVPWSQEEMPVTEEMLQTASGDDVALVILGRTAGEDQDNTDKPGSYKLTRTEEDLIRKVSSQFSRTAVILNVGNIIDMKWVREFDPAAVLYAWQGGQEGGNGVCDVLTGRVNPCGKLTDTIAEDISDYPSTSNFGDLQKNYYKEDIYVGYRYFETFAKDKVLYPFGFGLSYTSFFVQASAEEKDEHTVCVKATVKNTGTKPGKEVLEVYAKAPQGVLDTPVRVLCGFAKTKELAAGEEEHITLEIPKNTFASYDDSGVTGHRDCFVLLEGTYTIYVGTDVRTAQKAGSYPQTFTVIEQLEEVCAPQKPFARMTRKPGDVIGYSDTPERIYGPYDRVEKPAEISQTGDKGYRLEDVYDKKISMETFVAQLSDEDLIMLFRGEGMCSPKVTPGTAAAFAGLTPSLRKFRIPAECASDGPSGIRMDCGTKAFSLPNGTLLGCTFNCELVRQLYEMTGLELRLNRVDTLLGPGLNIHRNPLNGRNFEYISEDPFLTGKMGAAQLQGLNIAGSTGTIKHF